MATNAQTIEELLGARFAQWARRTGLGGKLAVVLGFGAVAAGVATYLAFTGAPPFGPDPGSVLVLLLVDLAVLLSISAIILRRLVLLWVERRRGSAGSRMHARLVLMFSIVAVAPAIIVAVFSALFFNLGVQAWFSDRVKTALSESVAVGEAYIAEHRKVIVADARNMGADLTSRWQLSLSNPDQFSRFVAAVAGVRSMPEALVFDANGRILGRSRFSFALEFDGIPPGAIDQARDGDVILLRGNSEDRVRALLRLGGFNEAYLYVGRFIDPQVLGHVARNRQAVAEYERLEGQRSGFEITFAMMFIVVALLLLMVAVWAGLFFATRLVRPVSVLVGAVEQVRAGDLSVRVPEGPSDDEIGTLSRAFNRMTSQLEGQRSELVDANRQLDLRRRFTEAVLAGVSAGVIGLDPEGRVNLPNRSALVYLDTDAETLIGADLAEAIPEIAPLLRDAGRVPYRLVEDQVTIERKGRARRLMVRVAAELSHNELRGFVVTFDDISELVSAQRRAAWSDIARRIAHEIKNPLTPIQLSAERLRRKYRAEIKSDPEIFTQCTDTIIRQVDDIGRMIDEFSNFARMPSPEFKDENIVDVVRRAHFMQQVSNPDISYELSLPGSQILLHCDPRQVGQAVTNLLQNAADSLSSGDAHCIIRCVAEANGEEVTIRVEDNGAGYPAEIRDRLTEPYFTARDGGTGLGLAIVRKIMEDHGGRLVLDDRAGGGARAEMIFPPERRRPSPDGDRDSVEALRAVGYGA
jgi:two-component system nitrogen regulation sensor histidine kinase NtrY